MQDETPTYRIHVRCESKRDSFDHAPRLTLTAEVVDYHPRYDSREMAPHGLGSGTGADAYADLGAVAYASGADETPYFYGYDVEYQQPYTVDLRRADEMVKVLRRVTRKLDALRETLGYAPDVAAWLPRFALALGIKDPRPFVVESTPKHRDVTGHPYREIGADDVARWIGEQLATLRPSVDA